MLVSLGAKPFHDPQLEVLQHGFIVRGYFGFPFRTEQQATMQLAGLRIDHVGFDTNTLLLPDVVDEVEWLHELQRTGFRQLAEVVTDTLEFPTQTLVLGLDALDVGNMGGFRIDFLITGNRQHHFRSHGTEQAPRILTDMVGYGIFMLHVLLQDSRNTLTGIPDTLLFRGMRLPLWGNQF